MAFLGGGAIHSATCPLQVRLRLAVCNHISPSRGSGPSVFPNSSRTRRIREAQQVSPGCVNNGGRGRAGSRVNSHGRSESSTEPKHRTPRGRRARLVPPAARLWWARPSLSSREGVGWVLQGRVCLELRAGGLCVEAAGSWPWEGAGACSPASCGCPGDYCIWGVLCPRDRLRMGPLGKTVSWTPSCWVRAHPLPR